MAAGNVPNLDDRAFERATDGVVPPALILEVVEDAVVNPPLPPQLPRPGPPLPQDPTNAEDSLNLESIMADAPNLKSFQELEDYRYRGSDAGTDSDVPEDSDDESDVSDLHDDEERTRYCTLQGPKV